MKGPRTRVPGTRKKGFRIQDIPIPNFQLPVTAAEGGMTG
jgi:hypothetical protein